MMKLRAYLTLMDLFAIAERASARAFLWAVEGAGRNTDWGHRWE